MPRKLFTVAALVAGFAAVAFAAEAQKMQILSFTGQIQIKVGNEVIGVVPGGKMPDIPAGAEIIIVSGEAVMQSGGTVIKAASGDSFTFNTGADGAVQIAATGEKTNISVNVGGSEAKVQKGDKIEVGVASAGTAEMKVTAGNVEVTTGGKTETVEAGKSMTASNVVTAPPPAPAPAPTTTTTAPAPTTTTTAPAPTTTVEAPPSAPTTEAAPDFGPPPATVDSTPPPPPPPSVLQDVAIAPPQDTPVVSPSAP